MPEPLNRRRFLRDSLIASSAAALSFEERALLAQGVPSKPAPAGPPTAKAFPSGRIGKLNISRLICGGNLISGFAHSRDLIYVSGLLRHYFTDEKVFETLALCEAQGVNTCILRVDDDTLRILTNYRKERGSRIQWIAQVQVTEADLTSGPQRAIDHGAVGAFVHGGIGDDFVQRGRVELLGKVLDYIRRQGVVAGLAGHSIEVPKASEKAGLMPDFYMKTFNSKRYWSAGPLPRHDSVWEETPQETAAFMAELDRPWIAYKVLGAGAIHPREGFAYAFQKGADFVCVGMFDFQVAENAQFAASAVEASRVRDRPWCA
jgi:hypothetical protein